MVEVYRRNNLLLNPTCKNIADFKFLTKADVPAGAAIYAKVELDSNGQFSKLDKIGSTHCMRDRFEHYLDEFGPEVKIIIILHFDSVPFDIDVQVRNMFNEFVMKVLNDKDVPDLAKHWFHLLRYRGGLELGFARKGTLGVVEAGCQSFFGISTYPSEIGLCDPAVHQERIDFFQAVVELILELLSFFPVGECLPSGLASWATSEAGERRPMYCDVSKIFIIVSQLALTAYVIGILHQDTIPFPAVPGAKTEEEMFSKKYKDFGEFSFMNKFCMLQNIYLCASSNLHAHSN